ncbi:MAG: STAS domain-containing protein [Thiohalomonadales bacterium]|nr:STAS domain-containing protein [Thiohalomonadales bacterium]
MSTPQISQQNSNHFMVEGELNLMTVPALLQAMIDRLPANGSEAHIDLAGVTRTDSAGLALLVEWLRQARVREIRLQFHNLPSQLRDIARISDLLPIIPLD